MDKKIVEWLEKFTKDMSFESDLSSWNIVGIAEPVIENDIAIWKKRNHKKQESEHELFDYEYVWQTVGACEDDYSGFILFPLRDNKYLEISYQC